jgi:hypothetical protein
MNKVLAFLILFSLLAVAVPAQAVPACNFMIGTSTGLVDGRSISYRGIGPGSTVCIAAGVRGPLQFRNMAGTTNQPITFINVGGKVIIDSATGWYGLHFANMQHFRLTGTGSADQYGILVQNAVQKGIFISYKSEYFELDHIEFTGITGDNATDNSIAILAKTDASCPIPSKKNSDDYDYNGDGKWDALDMVNRSNFIQHDFVIHDNYFHGNIGMAAYIGNSNWSDPTFIRTCIDAAGVSSQVAVVNPVIVGLRFYDNIIDGVNNKAVQFGSVTNNCAIYGNTFNRVALLETSDIMAININPGSVCDVYGNRITNVRGDGIVYQGNGGTIRDNWIENVGLAGTYWKDGIYVMQKSMPTNPIIITGNTIINALGYGITMTYNNGLGSANKITGNTIVGPFTGGYINASASYAEISGNTFVGNALTLTPQPSVTQTPTPTFTSTPTPTSTFTPTPTLTNTPTKTATPTSTPTPTRTPECKVITFSDGTIIDVCKR